jgi:hypothetical protein
LVFIVTHSVEFHFATTNGESSQNENIMNNNDEICLNDVILEEEIMEEKYEI